MIKFIALIAILFSSIGYGQDTKPLFILQEPNVFVNERLLVMRDFLDCQTWHYFPKEWKMVPGSFIGETRVETLGTRAKPYYSPVLQFQASFIPQEEGVDLESLKKEISTFIAGKVQWESDLLAQGKLKENHTLYRGQCSQEPIKLVRVPMSLLRKDYSHCQDCQQDQKIRTSIQNGKETLILDRKIKILKKQDYARFLEVVKQDKISLNEIFRADLVVDSMKDAGIAYFLATGKAKAIFEKVVRDPVCQTPCVRHCWDVTTGWPAYIRLWTDCKDVCTTVCSDPLEVTLLKKLTSSEDFELVIEQNWPEKFPRNLIWRDLLSNFYSSTFATNAQKVKNEISQVREGQYVREGSTFYRNSIRRVDKTQFSVQDSMSLDFEISSDTISNLDSLYSDDFFQCFSDKKHASYASSKHGYYSQKLLSKCQNAPNWDRRIIK